MDDRADLTGALELSLGKLVKEKYHADFYALDEYPATVRPFYTMPSAVNPLLSNSYDLFIRGQEICSGAQRCHEAVRRLAVHCCLGKRILRALCVLALSRSFRGLLVKVFINVANITLLQDMLEKRIVEKGLEVGPLQSYVDSFKHGVSPHAGAGIGLDRVVFLYLGASSHNYWICLTQCFRILRC